VVSSLGWIIARHNPAATVSAIAAEAAAGRAQLSGWSCNGTMAARGRIDELRERAIRLVLDAQAELGSSAPPPSSRDVSPVRGPVAAIPGLRMVDWCGEC